MSNLFYAAQTLAISSAANAAQVASYSIGARLSLALGSKIFGSPGTDNIIPEISAMERIQHIPMAIQKMPSMDLRK